MSLTNNYELWYTGEGQHRLLGLTKQSILLRAAEAATSKQMAEKILNMIGFDDAVRAHVNTMTSNVNGVTATTEYVSDREIQHVHVAEGEKIRAKWDYPQISDDKFAETLLLDAAAKELEKIKDSYECTLRL